MESVIAAQTDQLISSLDFNTASFVTQREESTYFQVGGHFQPDHCEGNPLSDLGKWAY